MLKKARMGFTLIEMLIVVGIIGILVAIAVPALSTSMSEARKAKVNAYTSQINTALSRYVVDHETKNASPVLGALSETTWDSIKQYMTINGQTGADWAALEAAICNNGTLTPAGGAITVGADGAATIAGVTLTCAAKTANP